MPRSFCSKCVNKLKISTNFKQSSLRSESYLVTQIKDFVAKFTKSLPTNSSSLNHNDSENQDSDDPEIDELLLEEKSEQAKAAEFQLSLPSVAETKPTPPKVFKRQQTPEKSAEKPQATARKIEKPKQQAMKIEKVHEAKTVIREETEYMDVEQTSGLYTEEEQLDDDGNIFGEEIYDIMEIEGEGSENIYLDESGKQVLGDDEGEFILVNFKSSNEDLTEKDQQFVVEELYDDESIADAKPTVSRKKHVNRMPREIIEKYAQSTENNQHICTKCVKVFSTRTNLIRHIQSHDGNKAYVCQVCSKGFTQSGSLKQHMYIHSGERPYKCQYCDRAFTQGKTLKFHLRRHTEEKPFICTECNSAFRQRDGLKRHLKSRHNIELKYDRNNQLSDSSDKVVAFIKYDETSSAEADEKLKESEETEKD